MSNKLTYNEACEKAATDQGLDPIVEALRSEGFDPIVEQTGGFTMVVYVYANEEHTRWFGITSGETWNGGSGWLVCAYLGLEDEGTILAENASTEHVGDFLRGFLRVNGDGSVPIPPARAEVEAAERVLTYSTEEEVALTESELHALAHSWVDTGEASFMDAVYGALQRKKQGEALPSVFVPTHTAQINFVAESHEQAEEIAESVLDFLNAESEVATLDFVDSYEAHS